MALVVLLRGVNVGGHRRFRPAVLAEQLRHLGAVNIGAAGTLIVRQRIGRAELRDEIARRLPFETEIIICESRSVTRLLARDFFAGQRVRPDVIRFVSVLSRSPRGSPSLPLVMPSRGRWLMKILTRDDRFVVGVHRRHMKAIGYLGTLDRLFGVPATTRSWSTLEAVSQALDTPPA